MVNYKCPRCGHSTHHKNDMKKHINRKRLCRPLVKDMILTENIKNDVLYNQQSEESVDELKDLVKTLNEYNQSLGNEMKELKELVKKSKGNTNITNITNNILVLPYRETDLSHLKGRDFYRSLDRCIYAVPQLIERTHFNPHKPENHNIYISNLSRNHAMVFDGKKWVVKNQDQMIDRLIRENEFRLEDWIEDGAKKFPKAMAKFKLYMSKRDETGVPEIVREEVRMLLYNNRELVIETKENGNNIEEVD